MVEDVWPMLGSVTLESGRFLMVSTDRCGCQDTQGSLEMIAVSELYRFPTMDGDAEVRYLIRSL